MKPIVGTEDPKTSFSHVTIVLIMHSVPVLYSMLFTLIDLCHCCKPVTLCPLTFMLFTLPSGFLYWMMLILHFKTRPQAFRTNLCHLEHLPVAIFSKMQFIFCHGFTWATAQAAVMSHWRESPLCSEDTFSLLEVILDTMMSLTIAHFTLRWKRKKHFSCARLQSKCSWDNTKNIALYKPWKETVISFWISTILAIYELLTSTVTLDLTLLLGRGNLEGYKVHVQYKLNFKLLHRKKHSDDWWLLLWFGSLKMK